MCSKNFRGNKEVIKKIKKGKNFIIVFALVFIIAFIFFFKKSHNSSVFLDKNNSLDLTNSCQDDCWPRLIDGLLVEKDQVNPFIIAAIIDNHSYARPQFSLSEASVVYDIPAEGGIDRYLAFFVFADNLDLEIGPIRSARPYFLDIAQEYRALILHCGGSPEALARISKEKILSLNEFYNENYFFRYDKYPAPHNVIAKLAKIKDYLEKNDLSESDFSAWSFSDPNSQIEKFDEDRQHDLVKIKNNLALYSSEWTYDYEEGVYFKGRSGEKDLDSLGNSLKAHNLIIQLVDTEVLDEALRLKIDLQGPGKAYLCSQAFCQLGYWEKDLEKNRTIYYLEDGSEFVFTSGKTWIHFINDESQVEINKLDF